MNLKVGDFVLVNSPLFGIGEKADLGPFIVQIIRLEVDGIYARHHLLESSSSGGEHRWSEIVAKIHERDQKALFKESFT